LLAGCSMAASRPTARRPPEPRSVLAGISVTIAAFALAPATSVLALVGVTVAAGAARGLLTLIQATAVTDHWGSAHYGRLSSRLSRSALLATAVAPWAGSALAGSTGGYTALFLLLAVLAATATGIATLE